MLPLSVPMILLAKHLKYFIEWVKNLIHFALWFHFCLQKYFLWNFFIAEEKVHFEGEFTDCIFSLAS